MTDYIYNVYIKYVYAGFLTIGYGYCPEIHGRGWVCYRLHLSVYIRLLSSSLILYFESSD